MERTADFPAARGAAGAATAVIAASTAASVVFPSCFTFITFDSSGPYSKCCRGRDSYPKQPPRSTNQFRVIAKRSTAAAFVTANTEATSLGVSRMLGAPKRPKRSPFIRCHLNAYVPDRTSTGEKTSSLRVRHILEVN